MKNKKQACIASGVFKTQEREENKTKKQRNNKQKENSYSVNCLQMMKHTNKIIIIKNLRNDADKNIQSATREKNKLSNKTIKQTNKTVTTTVIK